MFKHLVTAILVQLVVTCYGFHIQPRIISGLISDFVQFPFFVSVATCGGTLISDKYVLRIVQ